MRLSGKVAFITGAGSGIGRETAMLFVKEGAKVVVTDIAEDGVRETCELANGQHGVEGTAVWRVCDVRDENQVADAVKACVEEFGRLDIAFANAGVAQAGNDGALSLKPKLFTEELKEDFDFIMQVNVWGVLSCLSEAAKVMVEQGNRSGSLIATSSASGLRYSSGASCIYGASKSAVITLCQYIANQLTGTGIRCNALAPGLIETHMTAQVFEHADQHRQGGRSSIGRSWPLMRFGTPAEVASVALFLASDESSYITGQTIPICGGYTSSHPVTSRPLFPTTSTT